MASPPKSSRTTQSVIWGSVLILFILAAFAVRSLTRERVTVVAATVSYQDLVKSFSTTGKVEPVDDFEAQAQSAGQVQNVYVDPLQKVKPGQLLLKMDDSAALSNLAHAQSTLQADNLAANNIEHGGTQDERNTSASDLAKAKLQRQQDETDLASRQKLLQQGAESPAEINAAQRRLQLDDSNIASIEQHLNQRYQPADRSVAQAQTDEAKAAVAAAQSAYSNAVIRSPIAGSVYYLPVSQYDYVAAGDPLVYVADLSRMRVTAYFDEPDIGNLADGQAVTITWEAKPGTTWHGHISQAPTTVINYQQRFVGECLITVDDAGGALEPNANVTVTVTTQQDKHALEVPHEALQHDDGGYFVFRIVNGKLVRTPVQTGIINLKQVEIKSGLSDGDVIALNATTNRDLTEGLEVTPVQ
jgi:HlyD family secretion protein